MNTQTRLFTAIPDLWGGKTCFQLFHTIQFFIEFLPSFPLHRCAPLSFRTETRPGPAEPPRPVPYTQSIPSKTPSHAAPTFLTPHLSINTPIPEHCTATHSAVKFLPCLLHGNKICWEPWSGLQHIWPHFLGSGAVGKDPNITFQSRASKMDGFYIQWHHAAKNFVASRTAAAILSTKLKFRFQHFLDLILRCI